MFEEIWADNLDFWHQRYIYDTEYVGVVWGAVCLVYCLRVCGEAHTHFVLALGSYFKLMQQVVSGAMSSHQVPYPTEGVANRKDAVAKGGDGMQVCVRRVGCAAGGWCVLTLYSTARLQAIYLGTSFFLNTLSSSPKGELLPVWMHTMREMYAARLCCVVVGVSVVLTATPPSCLLAGSLTTLWRASTCCNPSLPTETT